MFFRKKEMRKNKFFKTRENVMDIGIDKIGFYVPPFVLDMEDLAVARQVEPAKYTIGIGQNKMAVAPITQDIVSMAANAAKMILTQEDKEAIDMVLFGTETGVDQSKSAAVYMQKLLGLSNRIRCVELKHACYGATAALQLAKAHVALNPESKVLVIASDIAKYGLASGGEPTQGAGAVAILVSKDPHVLTIHQETSLFSDDVMDFWRPNDCLYPCVDGKFSNEQYMRFFAEVWQDYRNRFNSKLADFAAVCFHLPYSKMGLKAFKPFLAEEDEVISTRLLERYELSTQYNRQIGNVYTGSLFVGFVSLLENCQDLMANDQIGFFSYGSGAVGEFFTGQLVEGYQHHLFTKQHQELLANRTILSVSEYEQMFMDMVRESIEDQDFSDRQDDSLVTLRGIKNQKRIYQVK